MTKEKRLVMQSYLMEFVRDARKYGELEETFSVAYELAWVMSYMDVITWSTYLRIKSLLMHWRYPRRSVNNEKDLFREDM